MKVNRVTYVRGWAGVRACPVVEGRPPSWIRRRPARGRLLGDFIPNRVRPVRILSTQTFRVAGVWIFLHKTFRVGRALEFICTNFRGFLVSRKH